MGGVQRGKIAQRGFSPTFGVRPRGCAEAKKALMARLASFLVPQADQRLFVLVHDNAGIGTADELTAVGAIPSLHGIS